MHSSRQGGMVLSTCVGLAVVSLLHVPAVADAAVAVRFDFNSVPPDANVNTGSLAPSTNNVFGTPTVTRVGGTTGVTLGSGPADFVTADSSTPTLPNNRSSDPATGDDSALVFVNFPAQGEADRTAGLQVNVDLRGYADVSLVFDQLVQNSASRFYEVQYSTDGGASFAAAPAGLIDVGGNNQWVNERTVTFGSLLDERTDVALRVVSAFAPGTSGYQQNAGSTYSPANGQVRIDYLTINATQVGEIPEPSTLMAIVGVGGLTLLRRRR